MKRVALVVLGIIVALIALFLVLFPIRKQPAAGMEPTIKRGSYVVTSRSTKIKRLDIAIFAARGLTNHPSVRLDAEYAKRVVGLPGEHITIRGRDILADGKIVRTLPLVLTEQQRLAGMSEQSVTDFRFSDIVVPEGQYFVVGDNYLNSLDSRYYGPIRSEDVTGKILFPR